MWNTSFLRFIIPSCYLQNKRIRSLQHNCIVYSTYFHNKFHPHGVIFRLKYVGWNFNFGNIALDWIQALLEWRGNAAGRMGPSPTYIHNGSGPSRNGHTQ